MRVPRLRFTLRWMLIVVAISGVSMASAIVSHRYQRIAKRHHAKLDFYSIRSMSVVVDPTCKHLAFCSGQWLCKPCDAKVNRLLIYHMKLIRKYERAAYYPWLAVASDPPEPE
jgi:hypothetical protein